MSEIILNDIAVAYTIIRSTRKSVTMSLKGEYEIEVKAPKFMPEFLIKQFIKKNTEWIFNQTTRLQQNKKNTLIPEFKTREVISFFGKKYEITLSTSPLAKIPRIYFLKDSFQIIIHPDLTEKKKEKELRKFFKDWCFRNMKEKLHERVAFWAEKMQVTYNTIRIKDVKGHWGSCSSKKNLNFNYRISLLPIEGIDYIIIHELSHLTEMNHSRRFWDIVERYMPDYKSVRASLKKNSIDID